MHLASELATSVTNYPTVFKELCPVRTKFDVFFFQARCQSRSKHILTALLSRTVSCCTATRPAARRLSSNFFPWGGKYRLEDLSTYEGIKEALARAGMVARATGQRLTAHPSEFVKLAAPRPELVEESLGDLELHGSVTAPALGLVTNMLLPRCWGQQVGQGCRFQPPLNTSDTVEWHTVP